MLKWEHKQGAPPKERSPSRAVKDGWHQLTIKRPSSLAKSLVTVFWLSCIAFTRVTKVFTSDSTKLPKANISVIASATDKQAPPFTWILDVFHRRPPLCDWICQPSLTFLLATVYHKQLRSQGLGNAAVLRFTVLIGVLSQPLVKRLRTQIWASESASAVWCVSAVFVFAREWPYEPSEPVGEVCSEPRKRSALGQARGAQAKPELNVAKPHF